MGSVGEIAPRIGEGLGSRRRLYVAEIEFEALVGAGTGDRKYAATPRFPSIKRDLAVIAGQNVLESQVRGVILGQGEGLIESIRLFDVYEGEQIPSGMKSLAYAIVFRSAEATLTDDRVDIILKNIENKLKSELDARIRMA
jgi:phenylalanyl-tRNA synthetase beta chain